MPTSVRLQRLGRPALQALAAGRWPRGWLEAAAASPGGQAGVDDHALPPAFAAERSLALQLRHPCSPLAGALYGIWSGPVLVGSCGFKDAADQGWSEIGYAIAPRHRRRGLGRQAVAALCGLAWTCGALDVVAACIEPGNEGSVALVASLGFEPGLLLSGEDGSAVVVWSLARPWPGQAVAGAGADAARSAAPAPWGRDPAHLPGIAGAGGWAAVAGRGGS